MRFSNLEKKALKAAFENFNGEIYLFGSRLDDTKKGGDIDILIVPTKKIKNNIDLLINLKKDFFRICEQDIDILIYKENNLFSKEVFKNAKRITPKELL
ncbi:MAG: nucleotidyltransferase domain-containing protein [Candidatus Margulisiibacteriota bacterium]|jgi:predicted nucleotidyltransferase